MTLIIELNAHDVMHINGGEVVKWSLRIINVY
jgi:hypothetical protein